MELERDLEEFLEETGKKLTNNLEETEERIVEEHGMNLKLDSYLEGSWM